MHDAHLPAYAKAGFPVAALVDVDRAKAEALARKFHVSLGTDSIAEAIRFAPANSIFDIAVPAKAIPSILEQLPDGASVLLQKPMETISPRPTRFSLCVVPRD